MPLAEAILEAGADGLPALMPAPWVALGLFDEGVCTEIIRLTRDDAEWAAEADHPTWVAIEAFLRRNASGLSDEIVERFVAAHLATKSDLGWSEVPLFELVRWLSLEQLRGMAQRPEFAAPALRDQLEQQILWSEVSREGLTEELLEAVLSRGTSWVQREALGVQGGLREQPSLVLRRFSREAAGKAVRNMARRELERRGDAA